MPEVTTSPHLPFSSMASASTPTGFAFHVAEVPSLHTTERWDPLRKAGTPRRPGRPRQPAFKVMPAAPSVPVGLPKAVLPPAH